MIKTEYIIGERGTGRTRRAILEYIRTDGSALLVPSVRAKEHIKLHLANISEDYVEFMEDVYSFHEFSNLRGRRFTTAIIDDLEFFSHNGPPLFGHQRNLERIVYVLEGSLLAETNSLV